MANHNRGAECPIELVRESHAYQVVRFNPFCLVGGVTGLT